jgi:two-component system, chemotaxis family, chemotaxis protein CheY
MRESRGDPDGRPSFARSLLARTKEQCNRAAVKARFSARWALLAVKRASVLPIQRLANANQAGGEMRALVVDDSTAMRSILRMILKQRGFEVIDAADGKKGLEALQLNGAVDVALFDWNMPEMTGIELLKKVREDRAFDSMRIMMVTTETEITEVQRALQQGADEYIMKPFSRDAVITKLAMLGF